MASFYKYETVSIPLKFTPTGVLSNYKHIIVSIVQEGVIQIDKDEDDLTINTANDTITFSLTQEETAKFLPTKAVIQVNIYYNDNERDVSTKATIDILDNLYDKVIADE